MASESRVHTGLFLFAKVESVLPVLLMCRLRTARLTLLPGNRYPRDAVIGNDQVHEIDAIR